MVERRRFWLLTGFLGLMMGAVLVLWRRRRASGRRSTRAQPGAFSSQWDHIIRFDGLSEAEAAERSDPVDLDELVSQEESQFLRKAIRQNLFTIFNADLFAFSLIMLVLGNPWGTVATLAVFGVNLALNVSQMMLTKKRLDRILKKLQPQAAVIRDGQIKSIDPVNIVEGDFLAAGAGDQILVDGVLQSDGPVVVEQTLTNGQVRQFEVFSGGRVYAASYCLSGNAVYRASEAGRKRYLTAPGSNLQLLGGEKTPLQRLVDVILLSLLGLVAAISLLLVADAYLGAGRLVSDQYMDAFSIVFGVAPTSLFFILVIQYAFGTFRISEIGALVYKAQTIEALSNVSILCLSKSSLMRGVQVKVEPVEPPEGVQPLSEKVIRRFLGDFLHSLPIYASADRILWDALPGTPRRPVETAPFLSELGWLGMSFDDPDLRGTMVVGLPHVLQPKLVREKTQVLREVEQSLAKAQRGVGRVWDRFSSRLRRRSQVEPSEAESDAPETRDDGNSGVDDQAADEPVRANDLPVVADPIPAEEPPDSPAWVKRMVGGFKKLLKPLEERNMPETIEEERPDQTIWLCTYLPEPRRLYGRNNRPRLPDHLIPLAYLEIENTVRPEAQNTIRKLRNAGLQVKILAEDKPENSIALAREMGWEDEALRSATGAELRELAPQAYRQTVQTTTIFGGLSPAQKAAVVRTLRAEGEYVAMVGDQVSDVYALGEANMRVALRNSAQAALSLTDIVLLEDSLEALPAVLVAGQRMVNGILDTFKLHLSQVGSQLLLILGLLMFRLNHFPYHPTQGSIISAFTITLPNIFLAAWSAAVVLTGKEMRRQLLRFVLPASVLLAFLSYGVSELFLNRTPGGSFSTELLQNLNIRNEQFFYASMAVTYALLMAGWLRVLFLQPPTPFWTGGAPLRGDRRVFRVILFAMGLLAALLIFPFLPFQEWLRVTWMPDWQDYLLIGSAALIWAFVLRGVWRWVWPANLADRISWGRNWQKQPHLPVKLTENR